MLYPRQSHIAGWLINSYLYLQNKGVSPPSPNILKYENKWYENICLVYIVDEMHIEMIVGQILE